MTDETRWIDPFSHPDSEELPLREAGELAHKMYTEHATGKPTGVRAVGVGKDKLYFYVKDKKVGEKLPRWFHGHACEVQVTGEPRPLTK